MKFLWCTIAVNDIEKSLNFYQDIVGLSIEDRFTIGQNSEIIFLGDGETKIELISDGNSKSIVEKEGISIGFKVNSVDDMMNLVKEKGIDVHSGPIEPNPHVKFFFVLDPNGVKVQFVENK